METHLILFAVDALRDVPIEIEQFPFVLWMQWRERNDFILASLAS